MKATTYEKPLIKVFALKGASLCDGFGVHNSVGGDEAAKGNKFFEEDEEATPTQPAPKQVWGD